ncbi:hypothetical protein Tco_1155501 [Tanacetum coccineum]
MWTCDLSEYGEFKVKVIRNFIDDLFLPSSNVETRWVKFIPIKVNVFSWRARRDRLPTRVKHSLECLWIPSISSCTAAMEDVQHVFFRSGDVVLRESYKPKTRGKLYYACPRSKPRENYFGCEFFLWKEERVRLLVGSPGASTTPSYSPGPSTTPSYSPGPSTSPSYSSRPSRNTECANCKLLIGKLQVLEETLDMYMHPGKHTIDSTALLHELYNDMGKFSLE